MTQSWTNASQILIIQLPPYLSSWLEDFILIQLYKTSKFQSLTISTLILNNQFQASLFYTYNHTMQSLLVRAIIHHPTKNCCF
jgi:hypothetical protein